MTCRDEIIDVVHQIVESKGKNEFTIPEVIDQMANNGTQYTNNGIRTEICNRLCVNSPKNHAVKHDDFERVDRGVYKILD